MPIITLKDLNKDKKVINLNKDKNKDNYKYNIGYRLSKYKEINIFKFLILEFLELVFIIFKFFIKPKNNKNIINIYEDVEIYKDNKTIICKAILDTGNETITIISEEIINKLGYIINLFDKGDYIIVKGIGGEKKIYTMYLEYNICGFIHKGDVGISTEDINYDMIVSQNDISKMYHSGYNLKI